MKHFRLFNWFVTGAGMILAGAASCRATRDNSIPIGSYLSLSGVDSTFGIDAEDGIKLAVEERNARGGIKGRPVRMIYEDDKSTPQESANKVRQLIDRDSVVGIVGEMSSSLSMAGGLIANTKKVPMIAPGATALEVTQDREYVFRSCFTDAQQGWAAAHYLVTTLEKRRAGIFFAAQDTYSSGLAQSFRDQFTKAGGTIVIDKGYQKGETNFTTYLQEFKAANIQSLFLPVYYNDMVQIARQAKQVGLSAASFIGGDGWDSATLLDGAGQELEGAHFLSPYAPDVPWESAQSFLALFRQKYRREPNSINAQGYDAAILLFDAMQRAVEIQPDSIKEALIATKGFMGATGPTTIDKSHNANKPIVIVEIADRKFKFSGQLTMP